MADCWGERMVATRVMKRVGLSAGWMALNWAGSRAVWMAVNWVDKMVG